MRTSSKISLALAMACSISIGTLCADAQTKPPIPDSTVMRLIFNGKDGFDFIEQGTSIHVPVSLNGTRFFDGTAGYPDHQIRYQQAFADFNDGQFVDIDLNQLNQQSRPDFNTGWSFAVLLASYDDLAGNPDGASPLVFLDENKKPILGVSITHTNAGEGRRIQLDLSPGGLNIGKPIYSLRAWDPFRPVQLLEDYFVVVTIQKDGKLRIDAEEAGGADGQWNSALIDGGWPSSLPNILKRTVIPIVPRYIRIGGWMPTSSRNILGQFWLFNRPLMQTGVFTGNPGEEVNVMSPELFKALTQTGYLDDPASHNVPCNSGHWMAELAEKTRLGPIPKVRFLCDYLPQSVQAARQLAQDAAAKSGKPAPAEQLSPLDGTDDSDEDP